MDCDDIPCTFCDEPIKDCECDALDYYDDSEDDDE